MSTTMLQYPPSPSMRSRSSYRSAADHSSSHRNSLLSTSGASFETALASAVSLVDDDNVDVDGLLVNVEDTEQVDTAAVNPLHVLASSQSDGSSPPIHITRVSEETVYISNSDQPRPGPARRAAGKALDHVHKVAAIVTPSSASAHAQPGSSPGNGSLLSKLGSGDGLALNAVEGPNGLTPPPSPPSTESFRLRAGLAPVSSSSNPNGDVLGGPTVAEPDVGDLDDDAPIAPATPRKGQNSTPSPNATPRAVRTPSGEVASHQRSPSDTSTSTIPVTGATTSSSSSLPSSFAYPRVTRGGSEHGAPPPSSYFSPVAGSADVPPTPISSVGDNTTTTTTSASTITDSQRQHPSPSSVTSHSQFESPIEYLSASPPHNKTAAPPSRGSSSSSLHGHAHPTPAAGTSSSSFHHASLPAPSKAAAGQPPSPSRRNTMAMDGGGSPHSGHGRSRSLTGTIVAAGAGVPQSGAPSSYPGFGAPINRTHSGQSSSPHSQQPTTKASLDSDILKEAEQIRRERTSKRARETREREREQRERADAEAKLTGTYVPPPQAQAQVQPPASHDGGAVAGPSHHQRTGSDEISLAGWGLPPSSTMNTDPMSVDGSALAAMERAGPAAAPVAPTAVPAAATAAKPADEENKVLVGNLIGEDHVNYVLMYNMLTGIRIGVSRCEAKMKRPLTPEDYTASHKYSFDITGNELTPSARYDFKFKDYAPWVFRTMREENFYLDPADYLLSLTSKYILSELGSPGKSGSFFYFSRDYRFIIKTIHHNEHKFLRKILPLYHKHVRENPHTLLSRFYGLHRVKLPRGRKIHFVIMNNLFPPHRDIHETYDLKGSTVGREYPEAKARENPRAVLKDINWIDRKRVLELGPEKRALLTEQLRRDEEFLKSVNVMDYSLLIGIHNMQRGNRDNLRRNTLKVFKAGPDMGQIPPGMRRRRGSHSSRSEMEGAGVPRHRMSRGNTSVTTGTDVHHHQPHHHQSYPPIAGAHHHHHPHHASQLSHGQTIGSLSDELPDLDDSDRQHFIFYQDEGGFKATDEANRPMDTIYYLGVIDITTPYNSVKKLEHFWKGLRADVHKISPVPAAEYGSRFFDFLTASMRGGGGTERFKPESRSTPQPATPSMPEQQ